LRDETGAPWLAREVLPAPAEERIMPFSFHRTCSVGAAATLLLLFTSHPAHADGTAGPAASDPFAAGSLSGVSFGVAGGISSFHGDAASELDSRTAASLHAYGGYRFSNGLSPELVFFHASSVMGLSPGVRWWLPIDGRLRPWVGAHAGLDHMTRTSGDSSTGSTYWSVDAGAGLDLMVAHSVSFGIAADATYANMLNPPRAQPVPPGAAAAQEPSNALRWVTMRAGIGIVL